MTTVRISGNWRDPDETELAGASEVDRDGHIARTLDIPEEGYQAIERDMANGGREGTVCLADGTRFDWTLERGPEEEPDEVDEAERLQAIAARDQLWASLRVLLPEIEKLAEGEYDGSERHRQLLQLLARIVSNELRFRAGDL